MVKRLWHREIPGGCVAVEFEPRDLWLGVYWDRTEEDATHVYACLLPCLPIHLTLHPTADLFAPWPVKNAWPDDVPPTPVLTPDEAQEAPLAMYRGASPGETRHLLRSRRPSAIDGEPI